MPLPGRYATAGSAGELEHELRVATTWSSAHHCQHGDFSRWVEEVPGDPPLWASLGRSALYHADWDQPGDLAAQPGCRCGRDDLIDVLVGLGGFLGEPAR